MRRKPIAAILLAALLCAGCGEREPRRIVLAPTAEAAPAGSGPGPASASPPADGARDSVLHLDARLQQTVGILHFRNSTGDASLDWLERGLSELLVAELSRAPHLTVWTPARMADQAALGRPGAAASASAAERARASGVDRVVSGEFRREQDEFVIQAKITSADPATSDVDEAIRAPGLEGLMGKAAELSRRVRERLRLAGGGGEPVPGGGEVTPSLQAWQHYSAGKELLDRVLFREARVELEQAVLIDPGFAMAWFELARARVSAGEIVAGLAALDKVTENAHRLSASEKLRFELARAQWANDTAAVLALGDRIWREAPRDLEARVDLATWLDKQGESERAREELEFVAAEDPARQGVYNSLGYLYAARGDFTAAIQNLERYRDLTPGEPNAHDSIGEVLAMSGRFEEALAAFQVALEHWPTFENSAARLADVQAALGDFHGAMAASDRWIAIAPPGRAQALAWTERAVVLYRFGRGREASEALRRARTLDPAAVRPGYLEVVFARARGDEVAAVRERDAWYAHFRRPEARADWDFQQRLRFRERALMLDVDPRQALADLDAEHEPEQLPQASELKQIVRGLLLYRTGAIAAARAWFSGDGGRALEGLVGRRTPVRGDLWRLVGEAVETDASAPPGGATPRLLAAIVERAQGAGARADLQAMTRLVTIQYQARQGEPEAAVAGLRALGIAPAEAWRVAGPYRAPDGFRRAFAPETGGAAVDWKRPHDVVTDGWLDLIPALGFAPWSTGYAEVDVISPERRLVELRAGASESLVLWVNGEVVWRMYRTEEAGLDRDRAQVYLRPGANRIRVKVGASPQAWGFYLRVTDPEGAGFLDLTFQPPAR